MNVVITVSKFFRSLFLLKKAEGNIAVYINIFYIIVMLACSAWVILNRKKNKGKIDKQVLLYDVLSLYILALVSFHDEIASLIAIISLLTFIAYKVITYAFSSIFDDIFSSKYSQTLKISYTVIPIIIIIFMYWMRYNA